MERDSKNIQEHYKILYHNTIPVPRYSNTDAVYNEIDTLSKTLDGSIINVYPFKTHQPWMIKQFMGIGNIKELKRLDQTVDLHHVFFPFFYNFPYFKLLKKPIVYTNTSSLTVSIKKYADKGITHVSSSTRVIDQMSMSGAHKVYHVPSGIDIDRWHTEDPSDCA